jgi:phospholipid transport system substrate-binding protein
MLLWSPARRRAFVSAASLLCIAVAAPAAIAQTTGQVPDAAQKLIGSFDDTLLSIMQNATKLGYDGRYSRLEPVIDRTFNVPFMTRVVVGPAWNDWTEDRRDQVIQAFRRFIIATYARRFDGYSGEYFTLDGDRAASGSAVLVQTHIVRPAAAPISLNYLMRPDEAGQYKVVDIFLTGTISELATRRSEFGDVLKRDGIDGLIAALAEKSGPPTH